MTLLPLSQTLGRASAPSPQAQRDVLLRSTLRDPQTPAEELLRATEPVPNPAPLPLQDRLTEASAEPLQSR